jgi:C4-dicarboxylate-specific signal transduction histidine kinase
MTNTSKKNEKNRSQWLSVAVIVCLVVFTVIVAGYREYQDEFLQSTAESRNLSLVLDEHTQSTFKKIDLIVQHAQEKLNSMTDASLNPEVTSRILSSIKENVAEAEILVITDSEGNEIGNSAWIHGKEKSFKLEKISITDRPYFIKQKNEASLSLLISDPVISRTTGKLIVTISRKLLTLDGKFRGIVFASLNLKTFSDFFATLNPGKHGAVSLYSLNKMLLARYPFPADKIGKQISDLPDSVIVEIKNGKDTGEFSAASEIDQIPRIYNYTYLHGLNLLLVIGKAREDILSIWWRQQGVSAILLLLLIGTIVRVVVLYLRKLHEADAQREIAMQAMKMSALGEIAAGIAHEINNPLTVISGKAKLMISWINSGKLDPDQLINTAQKIEGMVVRITKIIKGLKSYSRNSFQDPKETVQISKIINSTVELAAFRMKSNSVTLNLKDIPDVSLFCNETQITQVFVNLLNNASDAVSDLDDKWIEIAFELTESNLQVKVTDSGNGISEEVANKLMQPFFTTKGVDKGTGLGLSISKKIIEDHGGELWLDKANKHTRFNVQLPIHR